MLPLERVEVGARLFGRLRLDRALASGLGWSIFLADDEERSEFVLVVVASTRKMLEERLAEVEDAVRRDTFEACFVAEIPLEERHLEVYGQDLLFPLSPTSAHSDRHQSGKPERILPDCYLFAKRYRVMGVLGRGGMGEVYRARDTILRRDVALKVLRIDGRGVEVRTAKERLLDEARVAAGLRHPNIVEIFDAGEADGLPYVTLEVCEGGTFRNIIQEDAASDSARFRWLRQIADALTFAHACGVVHRDVKPENILLTKSGVAKLADFGIAEALSNRFPRGVAAGILGTPRYMAPEQLFGGPDDERADQFSWALLAEEVMSGVHRRDPSAGDMQGSSGRERPLSNSLREVIERASRNGPQARFPTMEALCSALDSVANVGSMGVATGDFSNAVAHERITPYGPLEAFRVVAQAPGAFPFGALSGVVDDRFTASDRPVVAPKVADRERPRDARIADLDDHPEPRLRELAIRAASHAGDTLGGVFEVIATGVPAGLGSHVQWDRKLDGRLAQALTSIQAIKGVEVGDGWEAAARRGSQVHDPIEFDLRARFTRPTNHAGGLEGGVTNGEPVVCRAAMKPIATLRKALRSVDIRTKEPFEAAFERSDICAVGAASVVGEAMVAIVLCDAVLEKLGGGSLRELARNVESYRAQLAEY